MTTKQQPLVAVSLDESGSMISFINETIAGYNAYVAALTASDGSMPFIYTAWDSIRFTRDETVPILRARRLSKHNYRPGASTPLYDSVIRIIEIAALHRLPNQPVICVIITDGYENASRRNSLTDLKLEISRRQEDGWVFVFMGANQDAWLSGEEMGIRHTTIQTFNQKHTVELFVGLSEATVAYIANGEATPDEFWDATDATRFGGKNRMTY